MKIILICGVGGSGKTACLEKLSEIIPNNASFSIDYYKEILYNNLGFDSVEEKLKLDKIAFDIVYSTILSSLHCNYAIIEYPFSSTRVKQLEDFIKAVPEPKIFTIRTKGDINIFYNRYVERISSSDRHRGHSSTRYPGTDNDLVVKTFNQYCDEIKQKGMDTFSYGKLFEINTNSFESLSEDLITIVRIIEKE